VTNFLRARLTDFGLALSLLTRIPVGARHTENEQGALARAVWAYPLVGALVGFLGALVIVAADRLGIPHLAGVLLGLGATMLLTGAFHEDGLADFCDGLGGGATRARKLEIMRDSRIGTYGALALILSVALRVAALAAISSSAVLIAVWTTAGALGRAGALIALWTLSPARADGLGAAASGPRVGVVLAAWGFASLLAFACLPGAALWLILAAVSAGSVIAAIAWRLLGGYTGDVLGAGAALSELAVLLAASALCR
jgi:adenosylcobinamide-GDP ribazoletransferase